MCLTRRATCRSVSRSAPTLPPTTRRNSGPTEIRANFSQVSSATTGQVASQEPRPISTSRQPVLPRSVSSSPSSKNSIQPPLRPSSAAAVEADDFRAAQAAGETDQQDRAIAQAAQIAEIERSDHGEQILGQDRLLLLRRAAMGAADPGEHGGDVAVLAVERLAALGEIPHQAPRARRSIVADRARLSGRPRRRRRRRYRGRELADPGAGRGGSAAAPRRKNGASRRRRRGWCLAMWRRGRSRGRSRRAGRGAPAGEAPDRRPAGGADDGSSGRAAGFRGSFSVRLAGSNSGMISL